MGVVFSKTQDALLDFEYYTEWQKQQTRMKKSETSKRFFIENADYRKDWRERHADYHRQKQKEYYAKNKTSISFKREVKKDKAECPLCKAWFTLTKSNRLHKHKCVLVADEM